MPGWNPTNLFFSLGAAFLSGAPSSAKGHYATGESYERRSVLCCTVSSTFTCTLKFVVKDCDPNTGEPDDEGYEDEYVVSLPSALDYSLSFFR